MSRLRRVVTRLMKRWSEKKLAGFTLIEVIIVVVIIGILTAIAVPLYLSHQDLQSLRSSLSQIETDLRNAQAKSKATSTPFKVVFATASPNNTNYAIYQNSTLVESIELPAGVTISSATPSNTVTYYQPYRTKETDSSTITLVTPKGRIGLVKITDITGSIVLEIP